MKAAEKKIINRVLAEKNIEVLKEYPENGVFGENQFFQLPSGIYLNVVDSGNGNRAVINETMVLVRTSGEYYALDTAISFNTFSTISTPFGYISTPFEFKYGLASNVVSEHSYNYNGLYYYFFGIGLESILTYVGDSSTVKLIVPGYSEITVGNSPLGAGSTFQNSDGYSFIPIYYDRVRYIFY